ncbi:MAG: S46 family peptidase [Bacteroidales bacterium]|nr:S46 family peptidase [Bacteroidales bacterium]
MGVAYGLKRFYITGICVALFIIKAAASEGMWMPDEKGNLPASYKKVTVMFSDMCSGVILSSDGLFLTNHHCALEAVRSLSSPSNNYLKDGFVAKLGKDEIPVPELNVKRLLYIQELTDKMDSATVGIEDEYSRNSIIESIGRSICNSIEGNSPFITATVVPYYEGNRYFLNVYEVFRDIRLVLSPPHAIASFGGETDNWMWPRCSADFALLRIYASPSNEPAYFSSKNRPLHVDDYVRVSTEGYTLGDSVMTLGFPGTTQRYSTSWEVEAIKLCENIPRIEVREKKLGIWKDAMDNSPSTQMAYSSKYAVSSNFYKYSLGMNRCIDSLKIAERKRKDENAFLNWVNRDSIHRYPYRDALMKVKQSAVEKAEEHKALSYVTEALIEGSEIVGLAWAFMDLDLRGDKEARSRFTKDKIVPFYKGYRKDLDASLLKEMLFLVQERVPEKYLPSVYDSIRINYGGSIPAYVEHLFDHSVFRSEKSLRKALRDRNIERKIVHDPVYDFAFSVRMLYYDLLAELSSSEYDRMKGKRVLFEGKKEMNPDSVFYSNANFTMRKSYGTVKGFPDNFYTTQKDLLERNRTMKKEYFLEPSLKNLYEQIGQNDSTDLNLCFISDNDITGGNSGSPVFNSSGELIGLAFDGNWEGMSGDLSFDPVGQRAIHVDIRYILFIVKNWAHSSRIYREITHH